MTFGALLNPLSPSLLNFEIMLIYLMERKHIQIKICHKLGVVDHACNPNTQEANAGGSSVPGKTGLYSETLSQNTSKQENKQVQIKIYHSIW
jgi:hypothetical protein